MNIFLRIDINLFAFGVLIILLISLLRNSDTHLIHVRLFLAMLIVNLFMLMIDSFAWIIDGQPSDMAHTLNVLVNAVYYIFNPVSGVLWLLYVDFYIFDDLERLYRRGMFYIAPITFNLLLTIMSLYNGFYFYMDNANIYHRGPGFMMSPGISYAIIIYTWFLSYRNRKMVDFRALLGLQLFIVPILLGAIAQNFVYRLVLTCGTMSLSILIVFISIEMRKIYRDYLTGAHSRRQMDEYIKYRIRLAKRSRGFAISMIDMDDFKLINDSYGHHIGDEALVKLVELITKSVRSNDFLARFAGDEFIIVFDLEDEEILDSLFERMEQNVKIFNQSQPDFYQIKYSIGSEIIKTNQTCDFDELFKKIDQKMYAKKAQKKTL